MNGILTTEELAKTEKIYEDLMKHINEDPEIIGSAICLFLDSYQHHRGIDLQVDNMRALVYDEMGDEGVL